MRTLIWCIELRNADKCGIGEVHSELCAHNYINTKKTKNQPHYLLDWVTLRKNLCIHFYSDVIPSKIHNRFFFLFASFAYRLLYFTDRNEDKPE